MLALGSTEIAYDAPLSLGSTPLDSIWLGDQLVWPEWQPLGKYNVIINNTNDDGRLLGVNDWAIDFLDSGGQLVGGTTTGYQLPIGDTTVYSQDAFRAGSAFVRLTINNADFLIVGVNSLTYDRDVYVYTFYVTLKLAPVLTELKKAKYVSTILGQSNLCISEDGLHWHIWSGLKDIGFPDINSFTPSGIVGINYIWDDINNRFIFFCTLDSSKWAKTDRIVAYVNKATGAIEVKTGWFAGWCRLIGDPKTGVNKARNNDYILSSRYGDLVVVEGPLHDIYTNYAIAGKVNSQAGYRLVCDSSNNIFMGLNSHGLAKISALNYTGSRLNIPVPSDNIDTIEHYNTGFVQLSTSSPNDSLLVGMYNSEQPSYITAGWKLRAFLFNFNNNSLITILEDGDSDKKRWPDNFSWKISYSITSHIIYTYSCVYYSNQLDNVAYSFHQSNLVFRSGANEEFCTATIINGYYYVYTTLGRIFKSDNIGDGSSFTETQYTTGGYPINTNELMALPVF